MARRPNDHKQLGSQRLCDGSIVDGSDDDDAWLQVLNCLYWVGDETVIDPFFDGFFEAFNKKAPPPPSRTEFVGASPGFQCVGGVGGAACPVLNKCIAAMPAPTLL